MKMLKEGLSIELIARVTGLDKEEIEKINSNLECFNLGFFWFTQGL